MREKALTRKITPARNTVDAGLGKVPPQALDLEEAILGALMLEKKALSDVVGFLKPEHFYSDAHREVYQAILELNSAFKPIDMRTVTEQLRRNGKIDFIGGAHYIASLTSKVSSAANIEYHSRVVMEYSLKRQLIEVTGKIYTLAYEDTTDVFELLEESVKLIFELNQVGASRDYMDGVELGASTIQIMQESSKNVDHITGVPSGFPQIDRILAGFQKTDLIIVAARPGMGKTAWVCSVLKNIVVDRNLPAAIFSLEMSAVQLMYRLFSIDTEILGDDIKRGKLNDIEWRKITTSKVASRNLIIDDTPALNIYSLRAKVRRLKEKKGIKLIIVDYLQLMTLDEGTQRQVNREQAIGLISRTLKAIAKECDIPVIALSQLSRNVETRGGDKRPQLSDLRESGSIEQDADVVAFLYRPEYYKITVDEEGMPTQGLAEFIVAKHRNGSTGTGKLKFLGKYTKFANLSDMEQYHPSWENSEDVGSLSKEVRPDDNPF